MNALDTVLGVIKEAAPSVVGMILPPPFGSMAEKLIRSITGDDKSSIEDAAAKIANNPELMVKLRQAAVMEEAQYQETLRTQIVQVNETMRAELLGRSVFKTGWRPFIGWCFGLALMLTVGLCLWLGYLAVSRGDATLLSQIASLIGALMPIFGIFAAVVGVAVHGRNKDKQAALGTGGQGMLATLVSALRGK